MPKASPPSAVLHYFPIEEQLSNASLIISGKLMSMEERNLSITYYKSGSKGKTEHFTVFYDLAWINVKEVLKAENPFDRKAISILMPNKDRGNNPFPDYGSINRFPVGDTGVWLLLKDAALTGQFVATHPMNKAGKVVSVQTAKEILEKQTSSNTKPPQNPAGQPGDTKK